ncbi:hypothetical protein CMK17_10930 [Candidatus Poribacteria bacterium]|nr:hypothetical protein [Candidatus Poribacteria bacterium]
MNRNIACFLVTFSFLIIIGCIPKGNQQVPQIKLTIRNTLPIDRKNVPVIISIDQFKQVAPDFSFRAFMVIEENTDPQNPRQNDEPIHAQVDDTDYDGERDQLVFLIDLAPTKAKTVFIRYVSETAENQMPLTFGFTKQTRAGIFPHLNALAAIESELSVYLLKANGAISVFAKKTEKLELNRLGQEEDNKQPNTIELKRTEDLIGYGGFVLRMRNNDKQYIPHPKDSSPYQHIRVIMDGPVRSTIERIIPSCTVGDKEIELTETLSIYGKSRFVEHRIKIQGSLEGILIETGIPKSKDNQVDDKKGLIQSWQDAILGQSGEGQIGVGLVYPIPPISVDTDSSRILLKPDENGEVTWYVVGVCDKGDLGFKTEEDFKQFLGLKAVELHTPPVIQLFGSEE